MPGILKIGKTKRIEARLCEANLPHTWGPPTPYKIEFAKKVSHHSKKEKKLHILLARYAVRIDPRKEFFRASTKEVRELFDIIDGQMWSETGDVEEDITSTATGSTEVDDADVSEVIFNGIKYVVGDISKRVYLPDEEIGDQFVGVMGIGKFEGMQV
jgi:hypothetical protein